MEIEESLERLTEFASSWNEGEVIGEDSGLTADDPGCLIDWMKAAQAEPQ